MSLLCNTAWLPASSALLEGKENESQGSRNERLGLLAGMFSALRESAMEEPDAYSENNMNRILRELEEAAAGQAAGGERPNIVLIASESFFDVTRLPGVTFHEDPIPNFRRLMEECAGGRFLSSAYAGGTGNVEMELFTGIPSAFPGASESLTSLADQSAYSRMPSLVKTLEGQGRPMTLPQRRAKRPCPSTARWSMICSTANILSRRPSPAMFRRERADREPADIPATAGGTQYINKTRQKR